MKKKSKCKNTERRINKFRYHFNGRCNNECEENNIDELMETYFKLKEKIENEIFPVKFKTIYQRK